MSGSSAAGIETSHSEVHLCDNLAHLLVAAADIAGRPRRDGELRPLVLFIDDRVPLVDRLRTRLIDLTGAEITRISDDESIEAFASLPRFVPGIIRRNVTWAGGRIAGPASWSPPQLAGRCFDVGYVYHPGFFLSKVVAGWCGRVIMRDSGYANYVRHPVPWHRRFIRFTAGRPPSHQTWGEEPWIDRIEVARPDQLPAHVRSKASRLTLESLMGALPEGLDRQIALAFWGDVPLAPGSGRPTALLLTQPIDEFGICSSQQKHQIYEDVARRLVDVGFDVVVKAHPREAAEPVLRDIRHLPAGFPVEAWSWLGEPQFDIAVSLNSSALADHEIGFARRGLQLIPHDRFYRDDWKQWPMLLDEALRRARLEVPDASPGSDTSRRIPPTRSP